VIHPAADYPGSLEPLSVIAAIERNILDWYQTLSGYIPEAEFSEQADHARVVSPAAHPACNAVLHPQFAPGQATHRIQEITAVYARQSVPALWWIGPSSRPVDLPRLLTEEGLTLTETLFGMAADLACIGPAAAQAPGYAVAEVADYEQIGAWLVPFGETFHVNHAAMQMLAPLRNVVTRRRPLRLLLGTAHGEPVSCAVLFEGPAVAALHYVGTRPSARNRGYGSDLVSHGMALARSSGYRVCVLHSTPLSVDLYRRLGFVEYCRLRTLLWRPPAAS
jgi:ribosomal protein S18 acetylase RimI-like enzyme